MKNSAISVANLVQEIGKDHGVNFRDTRSYSDPGYLEKGKLTRIDEKILTLIYSLPPLLRNQIAIDDDLMLRDFARKHRQRFRPITES